MSVVKAYALPHPPLAVPAVGRGQEKVISKTLEAFDEVAADIARIAPETIIYITPHNTVYADYFHISPGSKASGDFSRFGVPEFTIETDYDEELAGKISYVAEHNGIPAGTEGLRNPALDHGVIVPMWYINKRYNKYKTVRISQSGMTPAEHYMLGQSIKKAADMLGRKVVVIGSSDLSHRLSAEGPYGYSPEGPQFDAMVTEAIDKGDFLALFNIPASIRDKAGECGYNSLMVIAGLYDKESVNARLISYEGPFGVGYAIAEFASKGSDDSKNILEQHLNIVEKEAVHKKNLEDEYQSLARRSLEHIIETGKKLPIPNGLPSDMMDKQAGVFVSLHKRGQLRGCIGTIAPTTGCIAEEIIQNAVSAGLNDTRFSPVIKDELKYLTYKVDVLLPAEKIGSISELDVKKYGVIVTCGAKRGLLLPNLDGVDSAEQQVEIARNKGGISASDNYELERFEVIRHE